MLCPKLRFVFRGHRTKVYVIIGGCLTAIPDQLYSAFEITMTRLSETKQKGTKEKLEEMQPKSICGLLWREELNCGLKATIEFRNTQALQTFSSFAGIPTSAVEGIHPDAKYNRSAHDRIHGKLTVLMEDFQKGDVHPVFEGLGITANSSVERFCSGRE